MIIPQTLTLQSFNSDRKADALSNSAIRSPTGGSAKIERSHLMDDDDRVDWRSKRHDDDSAPNSRDDDRGIREKANLISLPSSPSYNASTAHPYPSQQLRGDTVDSNGNAIQAYRNLPGFVQHDGYGNQMSPYGIDADGNSNDGAYGRGRGAGGRG